VADTVGFGIIGAGRVAQELAADLGGVEGARLVAVTSRTGVSAERVAARAGGARVHPNVEALLADPEVDVVYVATPHHLHAAQANAALRAGKAVLCEKPFTLDGAQAREVVETARRAQVFCMEAMWMRFIPAVQRAVELVNAGAIGEPMILHADFGVPTGGPTDSRFYDPRQGGGALLDRGVYAVSLATMLFGRPTDVTATAAISEQGVDTHLGAVLRFDDRLAVMSCSLDALTANTAVVGGTEGTITLHAPFFCTNRVSVHRFRVAAPVDTTNEATARSRRELLERARASRAGQFARRFARPVVNRLRRRDERFPLRGHGYGYEVAEVIACLRAGRPESPRMPLDDTILVMDVLDHIRDEVGAP